LVDLLAGAEDKFIQRSAKIFQLPDREDARRPAIGGIDAVFIR